MLNELDKLKIIEWNIHGAAGYGNYSIPEFVADEIMLQDADIVILTEFVIKCNWDYFRGVLEKKYKLFSSPYISGQNGVLIAIKKDNEDFDINSAMISSELNTIQTEKPNFLQVTIEYNEKPLTIIGTRIRPRNEQFKKEQYEILKEHLESLEGKVICAGDFNVWSSFIVGNNKGQWNLKPTDYDFRTPTNTWSNSKYSPKNEPSTWSHVGKGKADILYKSLIDHIVTKGVTIIKEKLNYSWDFVNENNGYGNLNPEDYKSNLVGLPDHAILSATIKFND